MMLSDAMNLVERNASKSFVIDGLVCMVERSHSIWLGASLVVVTRPMAGHGGLRSSYGISREDRMCASILL